VLSPDLSSLLLIYHAKLNRWLQPGGHAEPGDTDVFASARREAMEEAGVDGLCLVDGRVLFDLDIHNIPGRAEEPAHRHFDLRFLFLAPSWEATAGSDAVDFRWVGLAEVAVHESDASVMRAVEKLRRRFEAEAPS
jgi:8-oxo-dGTP pyrophosphatase MutT (NUDIX family)